MIELEDSKRAYMSIMEERRGVLMHRYLGSHSGQEDIEKMINSIY